MCHLSRGANCGHSQVLYLHAHLCVPSLSSNQKKKQSEITLRLADGDILSRLVTFFLLLQAGCAWSPSTSQGHIINGWAQSWGDQGKHGGQKLCPDCSRRGSHHAWRSATETVTYQCTHMYLFQTAGLKLKALACLF